MERDEWEEAIEDVKGEIRDGRTFKLTESQLMGGMLISLVLEMDRKNEIDSATQVFDIVDESEVIDSNNEDATGSPVERLKMRFAEGEIDKEEYQEKLELLNEE